MKKILDFLLIFLLVFLTISIFSKDDKELPNTLIFKTTENTYKIPADVGLNIENNTDKTITFNTCDDISINYSGEDLEVPSNVCMDVELKSGDKYLLDYGKEYDMFMQTGEYFFNINIEDKKYTSSFDVDNRGGISKIFIYVFYKPIYNLLVFLLDIFSGSLGIAIILITIIIRVLLIYPQHRMMLSQRKLQAVQPKIKELQEKYKGKQQELGVKLMELYKKEKVNPVGSCGFLLIQMPILLVIYNILIGIKDESNYYHLYTSLSSFTLDSVSFNFLGLDLLGTGGINGMILAISIALLQFIQIKLSLLAKSKDSKNIVLEKKKGTDSYSQFMPDPEMMNKFMLYGMPAMVGVFTFTLFAGIGLYWGISTLFMIIQQLVINKISNK